MSMYNNSLSGIAGFGFIFALFIWLLILAFWILYLVSRWGAFKKAGYKGWESFIPGHDQIVICGLSGVKPLWVVFFIYASVLSIVPIVGVLLYFALVVYYQVILGISTAKAFGKGTGFGIALAIPVSAPIAWFILGGKNVQYIGKNPCNDPIMGMFDKSANNNQQANPNQQYNGGFQQPMNNQPMNNQPMNNQPQVKFCTGCGYKVTNGERFCPGCGKEML